MLTRKHILLSVVALGIATVVISAIADAQRSTRSVAQRRQRPGAGFWANQQTSRSLNHARDYSQGLATRARVNRVVQPQLARTSETRLATNLQYVRQDLATVAKEYAGDETVAEAISEIEDHLTKAEEQSKELHEVCEKQSIDRATVAGCCNTITKELDLAIAEHDAMMRYLEAKAESDEAEEE